VKRTRRGVLAAIGVAAVWLVLELVGIVLLASTWNAPTGTFVDSTSSAATGVFAAAVFAGVGFLLAAKRPRNAIGWIFLVIAINLALGLALPRYALHAVVTHPGSLPGGVLAAALSQTGWVILISGIALLLLLFPNGRLPSRRWWPIVAVAGVGVVATWVGGTTQPGSLPKPFAAYDNPLGVRGLAGVDHVLFAGWTLMVVAMVAGAGSLVLRFRRAKGVERQQYKLFTVAAVAFPVVSLGVNAFESVVGADSGLARDADVVFSALAALIALFLPISVGIAVLRYRLYEIDRLISRTLVYVASTVVLGAAYVALVLGGQALFSSFAGGSNLAIAASTLVVATLFLPVRSRVQRFVDRRFYRRRYDAQRTLEGFGARLREQVDLQTLQADLVGVVGETMQPAHVSLWLRKREFTS
jgi:hypothetical protein